MKNEFTSYEQALELKELGFEATPLGGFKQDAVFYYEKEELYYDYRPMYSSTAHKGQILAPLYQQAFRWFREKCELRISNYRCSIKKEGGIVIGDGFRIFKYGKDTISTIEKETYEEAELACLKKLIEIVKTKEK
jgi:hypothetical protein